MTARREGRHHTYTVDDPHIVTMVKQIFDHIAPDGSLAPGRPRAHSPTAPNGSRSRDVWQLRQALR